MGGWIHSWCLCDRSCSVIAGVVLANRSRSEQQILYFPATAHGQKPRKMKTKWQLSVLI